VTDPECRLGIVVVNLSAVSTHEADQVSSRNGGRKFRTAVAQRSGQVQQATADPELTQTFYRLVPGNSHGYIFAIGYFPRSLQPNCRRIKRHF
jgi:hypothetical protein